ncbi:ankyrin repeat domain-containing protein [Paenibacillus dendritiformis]|uniref:ankyrin repeat domain-containing protein n=1 Tax=Paenibacillus dendritiformis TaxID=130049 RepID=UPI00248B02E5|nr:ankyrin repeat domain-containing protein [Paenibacillus dendritiformis]WGU93203.1 ankyrin repeat domain-containing protein [Paenibacillus dendritiformis]
MNNRLIEAAGRGQTDTVLALIREGADINATNASGRTAILAAVHGRHAGTVRALIELGADLNKQDQRRDNPLLHAGAEGLLDMVRLLLGAGADTRRTNRFGGTALIPAAERGHIAVVEELLTHSDVDVNHINNLGWTALLEAIILSDGGATHQRIVKLLLDHGADPRIADNDGVTPLEHAAKRRYREIEKLLAEAIAQAGETERPSR